MTGSPWKGCGVTLLLCALFGLAVNTLLGVAVLWTLQLVMRMM